MMHKGFTHGAASALKEDQTLSDYIARKTDKKPKKLTFEEWLRQSSFLEPDAGTRTWLQDCWYTAQANV